MSYNNSGFWTNVSLYLENNGREAHSYNERLIRNRLSIGIPISMILNDLENYTLAVMLSVVIELD